MPQQLQPLHQVLLNQLMPVVNDLYGLIEQESEAHRRTLADFKRVVDGKLSASRVSITDTGYTILPEAPPPPPPPQAKNGASAAKQKVAVGDD